MNKEKISKLSKQLRNIGPKVAQKLLEAGIDNPQKLKELGAKEAYLKIYEKESFDFVHHPCYLYALEGAIYDIDWREIPENKKEEFKRFTRILKGEK